MDELRASPAWRPALSLVAINAVGDVAGHVVCTRGHVGDAPVLGIGPLSVRPDSQRRGAGSALMHAALGWDMWRDTWLRLAHGAALNGRVTVLCGSLLQSQLESVPARKFLGPIHFCNLDCPERGPGGAAARPAVLAAQLHRDRHPPSTSVSRPGFAPTSSRPGTPASSPPAKPPTVSRPGCGTCLVKRLPGCSPRPNRSASGTGRSATPRHIHRARVGGRAGPPRPPGLPCLRPRLRPPTREAATAAHAAGETTVGGGECQTRAVESLAQSARLVSFSGK